MPITKPNKKYIFLLKLVFGLALIFFIGWKINSSDAISKTLTLKLSENAIAYAVAFILLVPLNWAIETLKWRLLLNRENKISFLKSYGLVLAGVATGMMTPNRIGNFIGRAYGQHVQDKENAIVATFLANIAQFMATLLIGLIALYLVPNHINEAVNKPMVYSVAAILQLLALIVFIVPNNHLVNFFIGRFLPKYQKKIADLSELPIERKMGIFGLALLRYGAIVVQFILVISCFIENISPSIWIGVSLTFLLTTIIPSVAFGKLFVREASAILVLGLFQIPVEIILACTFILWLFNLALPALIGTRLIFKK